MKLSLDLTNNNLIKKIFFLFFISILFILSGCSFESDHFSFATSMIYDESGVIVPDDCVMVYFYDEGGFHPGRSLMYAVFQFESEQTDFLKQYEFSDNKNEEFESRLNNDLTAFIDAANESIPMDYRIDFSKEYSFLNQENMGVYMVYYIKENRLITYITAT